MSHVMTVFDRFVEDIGEAGQQLTTMAAYEGSAVKISVFVRAPSCPLDVVGELRKRAHGGLHLSSTASAPRAEGDRICAFQLHMPLIGSETLDFAQQRR